MKKFLVSLLFLCLPVAAQVPNCKIIFQFTGSGQVSSNGDNRTLGCTYWVITYTVSGFSAFSMTFQSTTGTTGPGSWVSYTGTVTGTNPMTATPTGTLIGTGFVPWYRVNLTSVTGSSGLVTGTINGYVSQNTGPTGPAGPTGATGPAGMNGAISTVQGNGTAKPVEPNLNFIAGTNTTVTVTDDPTHTRTNVAVNSTGGGGTNYQTVQQAGTPLAQEPVLNFDSVMTCADNTGVATNCHPNTATTSQLGVVKPDGTTITISAGVISSTGGGGSSVPLSGWTVQNGSSGIAAFNNFQSPITFTQQGSSASQFSMVSRTLPGATYTVISTINCFHPDAGLNSTVCSLMLTDGTQYESFELLVDNASSGYGLEIRTGTAFSSTGAVITGPSYGLVSQGPTLKIQNNGTNRIFSYYSNGAFVTFYTEATGTFLTETAVGPGGLCLNSAAMCTEQLTGWTATTP
jgi:hypothetical protein